MMPSMVVVTPTPLLCEVRGRRDPRFYRERGEDSEDRMNNLLQSVETQLHTSKSMLAAF